MPDKDSQGFRLSPGREKAKFVLYYSFAWEWIYVYALDGDYIVEKWALNNKEYIGIWKCVKITNSAIIKNNIFRMLFKYKNNCKKSRLDNINS